MAEDRVQKQLAAIFADNVVGCSRLMRATITGICRVRQIRRGLRATAALGVLIFEIALNAGSMFNHANGRLPLGADRLLRALIVTPDMHRVHHSIEPAETNSNFAFNLSAWDRIFRTYRADPAAGHDGMALGVARFVDPGEQRLDRLLTQPFREGSVVDAGA